MQGFAGVHCVQHQRVTDALDLLGVVVLQQRADLASETCRHIGGAFVAMGLCQCGVPGQVGEHEGLM